MELRAYDPERDPAALWECKRAFELELGAGDDDKRAAYEAKLDDAYRERYLAWVRRCVADAPRCLTVAVGPGGGAGGETESGGGAGSEAESDRGANGEAEPDELAGYAFLLPERLAMIWDGAVLNELYVAPDHRGTGVAGELLDAAVERAREQDLPLDRLLLDVDPGNERARAFYERAGFEPWGELTALDL